MAERPFISALPSIGYAFLVAALFIFVRGYQFNTDDQAEHLPQVYQMLDPELYPHDYFVGASNGIFTVRHYYEQLVLFMARTVGLEWGLFALNILCVALMVYSLQRLAYRFFGNGWAALLAPLFALFVFYDFTVGGNHVMYSSLISSTLGKAIGSFAIWQFVQRRYWLAGALLGVAALFQALVGMHLVLVLGVVLLVGFRDVKRSVVFGIGFGTIAAFILIPVAIRQMTVTGTYDKELFYEVMYRFRNHHHYLPSLFPITHYMKFFMLLVAGAAAYWFTKPADRGFYPWFVATALVCMAVYVLCMEVVHILGVGKLQLFKLSVWIGAFNAMMIAGAVGELLSGILSSSRIQRYVFPFSFFLFLVFILLETNSKYLPEPLKYRYMVGNRAYTDLEKMHFWIETNTPKDAVVLISPMNNAFPCQAKRSMPIHYQAIIHEPFFMLPWYDDYAEIYGVSMQNMQGMDARAYADKLYNTRNYRGTRKHIDYRLDDARTCTFVAELGPVVHAEGDWLLTEFKPLTDH